MFAGIGGIRIAFEKAGGNCVVFTSEWDKYPAKVYEDNFEEKPVGDILSIFSSLLFSSLSKDMKGKVQYGRLKVSIINYQLF